MFPFTPHTTLRPDFGSGGFLWSDMSILTAVKLVSGMV